MPKNRCHPVLSLSLASLALLAPSGPAQVRLPHPPTAPVQRPAPPDRPWDPALSISDWRIHLDVADAAVVMESEQVLQNHSGRRLEATLLVPLPRGAVAEEFELWINGKPCPAEFLERTKATSIYESIVRNMQDPALLEYFGHDLLRARVFPIEPHSSARIRLKTAFTAHRVGNLYALDLPLYVPRGTPRLTLQANLHSDSVLGPVFSPHCDLDVVQKDRQHALASFEGGLGQRRRLTLYYGTGGDDPGTHVLCHKASGPGHFLLTVFAPATKGQGRVPRDVVFLLDRSGSMRDGKLSQAVAALQHGLSTLHEKDRFEILSFATDAHGLFGQWTAATSANRGIARDHLDGLRAAGGTALAEALSQSAGLPAEKGRMKVMVLLTDGEPTIGVTDPGQILAEVTATKQEQRLFCFGVGHDVNTRLLDQLGEENRGVADYILPEENLEIRVSAFFDRISEPVLRDVEVAVEGVRVLDLLPRQVGDLYAGSAVHLVGTYAEGGEATVVLRGLTARGTFETRQKVSFATHESDHASLRPLYASRKVAFLVREIRRHGLQKELQDEIIRLGREYGIVTPYTAALVIEEGQSLARSALGRRGGQPDLFGDDQAGGWSQPRQDAPATPSAESKTIEELRAASGLQSGRKAVESAHRLRRLEVALDVVEREREGGPRDSVAPPVRHVAGRVFLKVEGTWIDRAIEKQQLEQRRVVAFLSPEYFELLRRDPDLRRILALGQHLIFTWEGTLYEVTPLSSTDR